jgi:hypothetical protein
LTAWITWLREEVGSEIKERLKDTKDCSRSFAAKDPERTS